jgi:hypothetical protein
MSRLVRTIVPGAVVLAASLGALAQSVAPAPGTAAAGGYESAFEGYRPFSAEEVGDWRQANETVREIGGWRAYAREIHGATGGSAQPGGAGATQPPVQRDGNPPRSAAPSGPESAPGMPANRPAPAAVNPHREHR